MAELIFESITGPITGEGAKWWELLDSEDVSGGISSNGTFYVHPFEVGDTTEFDIGNNNRIVFPSVNVRIDREEIRDSDGIDGIADPNLYTEEEHRQLVTDIADTGVESELLSSIEGLEIPNPEIARQPTTESVESDFGSFADGYYVGVDMSAIPTLPSFSDNGIEVQHAGTLNLDGSFDGSDGLLPPGNVLDPTYERYRGFGVFPVDKTYTFNFDVNEIDGGNGPDDIPGTEQRDLILGGNGPDTLTGSSNNDYLSGGNGPDILNGTGGGFNGSGEIDVLNGGRGPDTFVLGEGGSPYYVGGGNADYAVIEDLQNEDTIQLGTGDFTLSEDNTFLGDSGISILVGDDLVGFAVGASSEEVEGVIV